MSTVVNLLRRLHDVEGGRVLIDGQGIVHGEALRWDGLARRLNSVEPRRHSQRLNSMRLATSRVPSLDSRPSTSTSTPGSPNSACVPLRYSTGPL